MNGRLSMSPALIDCSSQACHTPSIAATLLKALKAEGSWAGGGVDRPATFLHSSPAQPCRASIFAFSFNAVGVEAPRSCDTPHRDIAKLQGRKARYSRGCETTLPHTRNRECKRRGATVLLSSWYTILHDVYRIADLCPLHTVKQTLSTVPCHFHMQTALVHNIHSTKRRGCREAHCAHFAAGDADAESKIEACCRCTIDSRPLSLIIKTKNSQLQPSPHRGKRQNLADSRNTPLPLDIVTALIQHSLFPQSQLEAHKTSHNSLFPFSFSTPLLSPPTFFSPLHPIAFNLSVKIGCE